MSPLVERLARRLRAGEPPTPAPPAATPGAPGRRAAVAVLLHVEAGGSRVLLMKRAERAGDPWSGHISLPGGRHEPHDPDLLATAIRETHEELGVDLAGARLLGPLAPLHPLQAGPRGIEVTPFVFWTEVAVEPTCGPEALAAFWLPLETAASGALDAPFTYPGTMAGVPPTLPSWSYEGHVIWGLTFRILGDVLALARDA